MTNNAILENVLFHDGESPLKESSDLLVNKCTFQWKYPFLPYVLVRGSDAGEGAGVLL